MSEAVGVTSAAADSSTRRRVLRLVVEAGPIAVVDLAHELDLTAAGVRRHVAALEDAGQVAVFASSGARAGRGRPARRYVATGRGQAALSSAYADLATQVLGHLADVGGDDAVRGFATRRASELAARHAAAVAAQGDDVAGRVEALAAGLAQEGYAASARPVPGGRAVQLCQGHCPVQGVAAAYPQLCEAETRAFSELLGVHVQRLSTLASGGHVCTTHVPLTAAPGGTDHHDQTTPATRPTDGVETDRPAHRGAMEGAR